MKFEKAFTLVELLIVIVVIGVLAGVSVVAYNGIQDRAKETKLVSTADTLEKKVSLKNTLDSETVAPASTPSSVQEVRETYGIETLDDDVVVMVGSADEQCIASASDTCSPSFEDKDTVLMEVYIGGQTGTPWSGCTSYGGVIISHVWLTKDGSSRYEKHIPDANNESGSVGISCFAVT